MRKVVAIGGKHGEAKGLLAFETVVKRPLWHGDILDYRINPRREIARFGQHLQARANQRLAGVDKLPIGLWRSAAAGLQVGGDSGIHHLDRMV